jgi:glutathione reductase (NADPH)
MSAEFDYDLFIIGGGSGGVRAGRIAGRHGARVAVAEESRVGGTCVIRGCIPKKVMVFAARYRDEFEDAIGFGWEVSRPTFDWSRLKAARDYEVDRLSAAYQRGLDNAKVDTFHDRALVLAPQCVRLVGAGRDLRVRNIVIATGGRPKNDPDVVGAELAIDSDDVFALESLPGKVVIVGAGFVAIEFASIMNGLGVDTTIVHRGGRILRHFDEDVRTTMHNALVKRGIKIMTDDRVVAIEQAGNRLRATTQSGKALETDHVLMAIGRTPNTEGIGLIEAGVELDTDGAIKVDRYSQTTVDHIYAIGDVTNRLNLTPVAIREGHAVADNLFGGKRIAVDHNDVPHAVFGIPEIGVVGLTEEAARLEYPEVDVYQAAVMPLRHQVAKRDERTLLKLVVDATSDRLLGCHIVGREAAELIQMVAVAIKMRGTKSDLDATVALHPTMAEELVTMREPVRRHRRAAAE